jgi:hypothetical protein
MAGRKGRTAHVVAGIERGRWRGVGWRMVRVLVAAPGVELVPGRRLEVGPRPGKAPGTVTCRECGRIIARGPGSIRTNGSAYCLPSLASRQQATFADRVKSHRQAAGPPSMGLAARIGGPYQRVCAYESGRHAPHRRTPVTLVEVLGVGLVDTA